MTDIEMKPADKKGDKKEDKKEKEDPPKPPPTPTLASLRKRLDETVLRTAVDEIFLKDTPTSQALLVWLPDTPPSPPEAIEMDSATAPPKAGPEPVPEVDMYLRLLMMHFFATSPDTYTKALDLSHQTVEKMQALNRRSMDPIAAKELGAELADARPLFLAAQRTASLRHDDETHASLINRLLRSYLHSSLYDQADKLVSKTTFPPTASNAQHTRYHYHLGRIKAQAIRRAPAAVRPPGFFQAVHKLFVVVGLLMGDIPDRGLFRPPRAGEGTHDIVKAVRTGSLATFQATLLVHAPALAADNLYTLLSRLRQNVIKTGIRRLSLSYSLISLRDICAVRDGVIEGRIVHERGWVECGAQKFGGHVRAYGPERQRVNAHRKELAAAEGAREREKELAKEIQEGDLDDEDMGGEF
ncbi:diphenol oxidase-A2 [Mycena latifolia]|nr:diphenol oxidase-A2 [Mycena latifolia]